jgi:NAD(P)-dependent dehydrogenase (short-subunit alcohol dehydrogenase family)
MSNSPSTSPPAAPRVGRPVALVTGAAKRLGLAIAEALADGGHDIALHYRHSQDEAEQAAQQLRAAGAQVALLYADLADEASVRALLPAAVEQLGAVDVLINNASSFDYDSPESFGWASFTQLMQANCAAPVALAQALHRHLQARGPAARGCVVNLLDQKLWNPNPDYFSYTLSKAALESATTLLAMSMAPQLRVCGVAPGVTLVSGPMDEAEFERAHRLTPLQRSSTPQDIARTVRFLVESPAITGTTVLVDGGQHLSGQARDVLFLARDMAPAAPSAPVPSPPHLGSAP